MSIIFYRILGAIYMGVALASLLNGLSVVLLDKKLERKWRFLGIRLIVAPLWPLFLFSKAGRKHIITVVKTV